MIPAEVKKKENIAEYIVHMYQTEDLILTYSFNLNDIYEYVIKHMTSDEQARKTMLLWYAGIIEQMQQENITDASKRLAATQAIVGQLTTLHHSLLKKDETYQAIYENARENIEEHIALSNNTITNPVQICLNGIYGMLLLNLTGKKISENQKNALAKFGEILAYLSKVYKEKQPLK